MKTQHLPRLLLSVAAIAAASHMHAQTWQTVLARPGGANSDLRIDPTGNLYAVGNDLSDGRKVAIVLGSADQGATWEPPLDQYAVEGLNYAYNRAVAFNPATGGLLAGGNLNNLLPSGSYQYDTLWFIREWSPDTGVWETVDDSGDLADDIGQASCADILVTPSGDVYATGGGQLGTGLGWVIRKRTTGTSAFTTVDADYSGMTPGAGWYMTFHPSYGVFAVGQLNGYWTVRRSASGDLDTWETKDTFTDRRTWGGGTAYGILAAKNGDIYVTGSVYSRKTYSSHWVTRRSTDGGHTWSIVDDFKPSGSAAYSDSVAPRGIAEDPSGRLLVCGHVDGTAGDRHWVVRRGEEVPQTSKQKGKTVTTYVWNWESLGGDPAVPGAESNANAVEVDANGNAYVSGNVFDASGQRLFIVRRLPAGQ